MKLFTRLWTGLTHLLNIVTLSPGTTDDYSQVPLKLASPPHDPTATNNADVRFPESQNGLEGPSFIPPGAFPNAKGKEFKCHYPAMIGWESCSTDEDRRCWLRNPNMGQFDIYTDYEALRPHGIMRNYTIEVTDGWLNTDGQIFSQAKLMNGTYPGPWIEACWGDVLNITVVNKLKYNGTAIHWHGIRQYLSMPMDGVPGVTQCPIAPGDSFSYVFNTTQYGSSWYHSHYSLQYADGMAGPITIHGPSSDWFNHSAEVPLLMTDWSHWSMFQDDNLVNGSILLNGKGNITRFGCKGYPDPVRCGNLTEIPKIETVRFYDELSVSPSPRPRRYLLRIINTSFETQFVFSIDNHNLRVVSADFVPIKPYDTHAILVGIGQRYNVIVEANPHGPGFEGRKDFWIRTGIAKCFNQYTLNGKYWIDGYNVTGILTYRREQAQVPSSIPWGNISLECADEPDSKLVPILPWVVGEPANAIMPHHPGEEHNVHFDLESKQNESITYPMAMFSFEGHKSTKFNPLRVDYDRPIFFELNEPLNKSWPEPLVVLPETFNDTEWVYLLIQGNKTTHKTIGAHPIHLHGHDFAILRQSYGSAFEPNSTLNKANPARRDVVMLPDNGHVVIAFKADNPGNWLMHCHIAAHASFGLGAQILERQLDADALWPHPSDGSTNYCGPQQRSHALCEGSRVCDNWKAWSSNCSNWWAHNGTDPCSQKLSPYYFLPDSGV